MPQWNGNNCCHNIRYNIICYANIVFHDKHNHNIIICFISAVVCNDPLYVLHINKTMKESTKVDANVCCSGFLIARNNTTTCLENGEWGLETSQTKSEGDLLKYQ